MSHDDYLGDASPEHIEPRARTPKPALGRDAPRPALNDRRAGWGLWVILSVGVIWAGSQVVAIRPPAPPKVVEPPRVQPLSEVTVNVSALNQRRNAALTWTELFELYGLEQPLRERSLDRNAVNGARPDPNVPIEAAEARLVLSGFGTVTR